MRFSVGLKAMAVRGPACSASRCFRWPPCTSHTMAVASLLAEAARSPSGPRRPAAPARPWPRRTCSSPPEAASQMRAVPSSPPVSTSRLSGRGLKATLRSVPLCPRSVALASPVVASHTRAAPSPPAVTSSSPPEL